MDGVQTFECSAVSHTNSKRLLPLTLYSSVLYCTILYWFLSFHRYLFSICVKPLFIHVFFSSFISYIRFISLNFNLHAIFITSYNLFTDSSLVENCFIICRGVYIDHCLHQFFFRNVELSRVTLSV